jgi:L-alanine-DL-glutamate epimerase-like enolase superfamily enzyme
MKITSLKLWNVPLTSHEAYYMADGTTCDTVTSVVIALQTDAGITGWGEVCPIPHYLPAYAGGVAPAMEELWPVLCGADPVGPEAVMAKANGWLIGHEYAKSALDIALWDITGKVANMPLYTLLGGRRQADMPLYHSITCIAPDEMVKIARDAQDKGMTQFQVKLGADSNWEADVARLRMVREEVGSGPLVYGDWNCGATSLDAIRVGRAVQDLDIMLEQPCATMEDCKRVKDATHLPMKMDENAHDTASMLMAHQLGVMDAVAIKLSKFGGLSASRPARDLCLHLGARMCIEDTWGSDITTAALSHLGASTDPKRVMNVCDLSGYVAPHVAPDGPKRENGRLAPPEGAGLGITPDMDLLGTPALELE